jgi:hypothetical protein
MSKKLNTSNLLFFSFLFFMLLDLVTSFAVFYKHNAEALETNPLMMITGTKWSIVIFNLLYLGVLFYLLYHPIKRRSPFNIFFMTGVIVQFSFLRVFASINALKWYFTDPVIVEQAVQQITDPVKIQHYSVLMINMFIIPIMFYLISYFISTRSFEIKYKDE